MTIFVYTVHQLLFWIEVTSVISLWCGYFYCFTQGTERSEVNPLVWLEEGGKFLLLIFIKRKKTKKKNPIFLKKIFWPLSWYVCVYVYIYIYPSIYIYIQQLVYSLYKMYPHPLLLIYNVMSFVHVSFFFFKNLHRSILH